MEFITLTLFPLSEGQLLGSAALQIRSQPLAGAGSRHRDLFGQRWEGKPLAQPPASQLTADKREKVDKGRRFLRAELRGESSDRISFACLLRQ